MRAEVIVDGSPIGKTTFVVPPVAGAFLETKQGKCRIEAVTHAFGASRMRVDCTLVEAAAKPTPDPVKEAEPESVAEPAEATTAAEDASSEPSASPHPLRHGQRRRNR